MTVSLVTGGAGFIGSHLAEGLLNEGHEVRVLDNFETGNLGNLKQAKSRVGIIKGDVREPETLRKATKNVDYVFHLAAMSSVSKSVEDPKTTTEVNMNGTLNVLMASVENKVKRVVFASSAAVYGNEPTLPKRESMNACPESPYALSKYVGEQFCRIFHEIYGIETISLRYFNVFGPRQNPDSEYSGVISKFMKLMMNDQKPTIYGDGNQTRDFVFVRDVVDANIAALKVPEADGSVFNVASGNRISVNDLIAKLNEILGRNVEPVYKSPRPGDIRESYADITLIKERLGYNPEYDFNRSLRETVNWYQNRQS